MTNEIDMKAGLLKVFRGLLGNEDFAVAIIDLLLGDEDAAYRAEYEMKAEGMRNTLNEVVSVHRALKRPLNENVECEDHDKGLIKSLYAVSKKSNEIQSNILAGAMKKKGVPLAIVRLISTRGADKKAWVIVANAVIDSTKEELNKAKETEN